MYSQLVFAGHFLNTGLNARRTSVWFVGCHWCRARARQTSRQCVLPPSAEPGSHPPPRGLFIYYSAPYLGGRICLRYRCPVVYYEVIVLTGDARAFVERRYDSFYLRSILNIIITVCVRVSARVTHIAATVYAACSRISVRSLTHGFIVRGIVSYCDDQTVSQ